LRVGSLSGSLYLQGGARAPQVPQVAVASGIARTGTLMQPLNGLLVCNGSAAPCDEPRHLERLPSGGVTWPDRTVEAAVRRCHVGSVAWPVYASPVRTALVALWEKLHLCRPLYL